MPTENYQRLSRICAFCGETFHPDRADQRYHSTLCRQRAYRWRKRSTYHEYKVMYHLKALEDYLVFVDARPYVAQQFTKIRHSIDETLDRNNIRRVK